MSRYIIEEGENLTGQELINKLDECFRQEIMEIKTEGFDNTILVDSKHIIKVMKELKENPVFDFNYLMCQTGVDYPPDKFEIVYHLCSLEKKHRLCVKVSLSRENPSLASLCDIWKAAEWHEREIFDLFGVNFEGNPDMRRILLPEDFTGHPLRKDFHSTEVLPSPDKKELMKAKKGDSL